MEDSELRVELGNAIENSNESQIHDREIQFGRRLQYYLLVRALKPKFVVEAGVDRGFGACIIDRAIQRNIAEGFPAVYRGIEFNTDKEIFFYRNHTNYSTNIIFGQAAVAIEKIETPVDLFFHETTTEPNHVQDLLKAMNKTISDNGIIVSAWFSDEIVEFALSHNWKLLIHQDKPKDHWYGGACCTFMFRRGDAHAA